MTAAASWWNNSFDSKCLKHELISVSPPSAAPSNNRNNSTDYGGPQAVQHTKQKLGTQKQNLEQKKKLEQKKTWNRKKVGTEKKTWNRKKSWRNKLGTEIKTWTAG